MSTSSERMRAKRERDAGLQAARARGRALGEDEANRQRLDDSSATFNFNGQEITVKNARSDRIARAEAYAVWEYEGRPLKTQPDLKPYWPKGTPPSERRS